MGNATQTTFWSELVIDLWTVMKWLMITWILKYLHDSFHSYDQEPGSGGKSVPPVSSVCRYEHSDAGPSANSSLNMWDKPASAWTAVKMLLGRRGGRSRSLVSWSVPRGEKLYTGRDEQVWTDVVFEQVQLHISTREGASSQPYIVDNLSSV